jgi:hypothetical protein
MADFYVVDCIPWIGMPADEEPTDFIRPGFRSDYIVSSSTAALKHELTVFSDFAAATEHFTSKSNPFGDNEIVKLWKASAWTKKGAAKCCMKSSGVVVRVAKRNDLEQRKKDRAIGEVLLYAMENTNMSNEQINELHKDLKEAMPVHKGEEP